MIASIEYLVKVLKKAREEKKLSQRSLSQQVGIPQSHLSRIENAIVDLQASSLVEIARTLDLEVVIVPKEMVNLIRDLQDNKIRNKLAHGIQVPAFRLNDDDEDDDEQSD